MGCIDTVLSCRPVGRPRRLYSSENGWCLSSDRKLWRLQTYTQLWVYDLFGWNFIVTYYTHSRAMTEKRINRESTVPTGRGKRIKEDGVYLWLTDGQWKYCDYSLANIILPMFTVFRLRPRLEEFIPHSGFGITVYVVITVKCEVVFKPQMMGIHSGVNSV